MRKLFWWGAGLVGCAAALYTAADYAGQHPESWLGRCLAGGAGKAVTRSGGGGLPSCLIRAGAAAGRAYGRITRQACKLMAEPAPGCPGGASCPAPAEASEPIQVNVPGLAGGCSEPCPAGDGDAEACWPPPADGGQECEAGLYMTPCPEDEPEGILYMPPCPEDGPEGILYMPPCPEDGPQQPLTMPYADQCGKAAKGMCCPLGSWLHGRKQDAKDGGRPEPTDVVPAMPYAGPDASTPAVEPVGPGDPPSCQEDPYASHQYPGCPHMGGCCAPPMKHPEPPRRKKGQNDVQADPASLFRLMKLSKPDSRADGECIGSCGTVDTMECRPSDLANTGFDPHDPF